MHSNYADATIVISRMPGGRRDFFRSYAIIVDGNPVGKIKRGWRIELPVSQGQHELFLQIDWCTSRSITFDVQPGAVIEFFCAPGAIPLAEGALFDSRDQYIWLTRTEGRTP